MNTLTINCGVTNTHIALWKDNVLWAEVTSAVGVRNVVITGNKAVLEKGVAKSIAKVLAKVKCKPAQVDLAIASGMITSDIGLYEVAHVPGPAGVKELAKGMVCARLPRVFKKPIWFVPGVKNHVENIGLHNCEAMDIMRGEEVECMAVVSQIDEKKPVLIMLPGSNSKFISVDADGRITGCVTTLAGELMQVLTHNTIIASALDSRFASELNEELLLSGARAAEKVGLGRASFMVRILNQFTIYTQNERANFLLGAVLGADLLTLKNSGAIKITPGTDVIIGGNPLLKEAFATLVRADDFFSGHVSVMGDYLSQHLAAHGAITLAAERGLVPRLNSKSAPANESKARVPTTRAVKKSRPALKSVKKRATRKARRRR
jgi:2-dehydro-3-deoxygalactonokinase